MSDFDESSYSEGTSARDQLRSELRFSSIVFQAALF